MTFKDAFGFASNYLLLKNTIILQADCYIGQGFEHLNETILSSKTMYFLTRHNTPENVHLCSHARDFCGPKSVYKGSHDRYLFRLLVPVPSEILDTIDYRSDMTGIEQVLMFKFRTYGGYKIRNPCKILHIVHHHCVKSASNKKAVYIQGQRLDDYLNISVQFHRDNGSCTIFWFIAMQSASFIKFGNFAFFALSKRNNVFTNLSKPFFNSITGKRLFRPYFSHLHGRHNLNVPKVPKDSQQKLLLLREHGNFKAPNCS